MKLQSYGKAREILPDGEECKKDRRLFLCLAYYKFTANKFDEIDELLDEEKFDGILFLIKIYSMAKKQYEEQEFISNEKKMEIVNNLHLLHTLICLKFDRYIL